jgi:hypothetical protein
MIEIDDVIDLQTHTDTEKLSFATRGLVGNYFTFDLSVLSRGFAGTSHFCVSRDDIEQLCDQLSLMHATLKCSVMLPDYDSDGKVVFEMEEGGHVIVSGQVGGSHEDHYIRFRFETDQTCIPKLIQDFYKLLQHQDS